MDNAVITAQQVVNIVLSGASFDVSLLSQHIIKSQRKYLKTALGDDFYDQIVALMDGTTGMMNGTATSDYTNLLADYIKPTISRFVMFEALPMIRTNISSAGVVVNRTEFADQSDKADYGSLRSSLLSDAEWYRTQMVDFLVDNEDIFTLFENCDYKKRNRPGIILE